ncbi:MAG TPA: hypothetical protein VN861_03405 [Candidatus Acidoferrales bacterium]|nr:hypothetical protein [Candidatus Acidoferrales bacterium]
MANNNKWRPVTQGPAAEQSQVAQAAQGVDDTPNQGINPSPNGDPPAPALTDSQSATNPPATGQESASTTDLAALVANLSPEQLARVRQLANAHGIASNIGPRKLPNGNVVIEVEIPAEAVEPLSVWAEAAGEPLAAFISKVAGDAIVNYTFGDWGAVATMATVPAPVTAATPEPVTAK